MRTIQRFAFLGCTLIGTGTATAAGCTGETLVVGTNEGGAPPAGDDAASPTSDANASATACRTDFEGGAGSIASETASTISFSTCRIDGTAGDCANPGAGRVALAPTECSATVGPVHAVSGADDVKAQLSGVVWYGCQFPLPGLNVPAAKGLLFSTDGTYAILGVRVDGGFSTPGASEDQFDLVTISASGGDGGATTAGTYDVVDGSATYGAGTFELQLHPTSGGVIRGQIALHDAPLQFQFFPPNAESEVFSVAAPFTPRAGVCSCVQAVGTKVNPNDATALTAAMLGRWIWCGGLPPYETSNALAMGIEFTSGNTWYQLVEDAEGNVTRGSAAGMFLFKPTSSFPPPGLGPEPLAIELDVAGGGGLTQVVVTENPRTMLLSQGTTIDSSGANANIYSILVPAP